MKAARLYGIHDVRIEEVPTPEPGPGEVLVRVRACAICPSDWRLYEDGHAGGVVPDHPMIQGHEFSGDVVAVGPPGRLGGEDVEPPAVGTRVAVEPSWHCGECDMCRRGLTNLCRHQVFPSFPQRDGALAEYITCPAYATCPLPEALSYVQGALLEPVTVALHAVRLAAPAAGDRLLILGAGVIGLSLLMWAKSAGAGGDAPKDIALVEPIEGRRRRAEEMGAAPVAASARELIDQGFEADIVFEGSGEGSAVEESLFLARPGGKVVVVGIPHPERVSFEADVPRRRELTILFSRRSREELVEAVERAARGDIDLGAIPVRKFELAEAKAALDLTAERPADALRAVVLP